MTSKDMFNLYKEVCACSYKTLVDIVSERLDKTLLKYSDELDESSYFINNHEELFTDAYEGVNIKCTI